ncbi:hypothetical protein PHLGIDRAFT_34290 [Phlebiopsis gigantea 11061_1 CR5-6]|uniref:Uncharacterized protein n=1 Tax=Phlebiopsis gigantea (strain 11061_1 CR5-6) TaxID=745531 RepID=A0A0C3SB73_PHLG1|nr:hypothetical protein PHLGIDRAFT_34290 [Phlebiopsis gigantea 11061_1 CR5-6]
MNTTRAASSSGTAAKPANIASRAPKHSPRKDAGSSMGPGDLTPPSSDPRQEERKVPQMLMSPPPEETLQIARSKAASETRASLGSPHQYSEGDSTPPPNASKRKRNRPTPSVADSRLKDAVASSSRVTLEATPNPKPRKQSKLHVSFVQEPTTPTKPSTKSPHSRASASPSKKGLLQSPHAQNPLADYVFPRSPLANGRASSRRRSATPRPHYEPPPDRFTPPREVVYSPAPSISKSSKRKSVPRSNIKVRRLTLQIKKEAPEIDLNAPLPPPSPTEDPLLLHGPPPSTKRRPGAPRASLASTHSRDTPIISSSPVRSSQIDGSHLPDLNFANMDVDSDDDELPLPPLFAFDKLGDVDEPWTDDEQDGASEFDHAGEYTGKFKIITVPTKADPPSSMTRRRQDMWGRPISPFPRSKLLPALRHSPIPEAPGVEENELPIAEYDEEEPQTAPVRSPSPPAPLDAEGDVRMNEPADAAHPPPFVTLGVPPEQEGDHEEQYEELPVEQDGSSVDDGYQHSEAVSMEYSVRLPSEHESSAPGGETFEEMPQVEETVLDAANDSDRAESVLSYVDPGDLSHEPVQVPGPEEANEGAPSSEVLPVAAATLLQGDRHAPAAATIRRPDSLTGATVPIFPTPHLSADVPPVESTRGVSATVPHASAVESTDDAQAEWSFGVPQHDDDDGEENAAAEEEDAWSVIRELSKEPDEQPDLDPGPRLAPPPLPTPRLPVSPRNPFYVRTPGVASMSAARPLDGTGDYRSGNASLPQFDLPEDDFDESLLDPGIVKITSSDPMAAARAAAILRLHKYDCVQHVPSPKQKTPFNLESVVKSANRRSVMQSAIGKGSTSLRRSTLGGVVGHTTMVDGTTRTSLAELLREAEATIILEEGSLHGLTPPKHSTSFETPARSASSNARFAAIRSSFETPASGVSRPREWSKADWKALDSCYTDERLALGEDSLAPAEQVDLGKVVERFVGHVGERVLAASGPSWSRENLLKRARALQRKQMSANQAPPRQMLDTSAMCSWTSAHQYSTLLSPNTSILKDLDSPQPAPAASTTSSSTDSNQTSGFTSASVSNTIPTSSAGDVQYSQLLEDAKAEERGDAVCASSIGVEDSPFQPSANRSFVSPLLPGRAAHSLASKVKGLIFSYLPRSPKTAPAKQKPAPAANGPILPVPPPEIFKQPRPPITTPAPKRSEKSAAPKDLVQLNRVPAPKPSMIPRPTQQPRRWVQLNPVPSRPSSSAVFNPAAPRERRDSGASVKDLVKTFETMQKTQTTERELELRRQRGVKHWAEARAAKSSKATWRP